MLAAFPAKRFASLAQRFRPPNPHHPTLGHAIPAAVGGASSLAAGTRSGRCTGVDGLPLLAALPEGLQAQPRYRGAERFSAALLRRGGGRQERDGSAGGLAASAGAGGRPRGRGEWMGARRRRRKARKRR